MCDGCEVCEMASELADERAEVQRLRNLIGELYVARGGSRIELYTAIKRAFRAMSVAPDHECRTSKSVQEPPSAWTYRRPSDAAIAEAQAAYDRGEVGLLEAAFLADALSDEGHDEGEAG